jgi:hypothetical protein
VVFGGSALVSVLSIVACSSSGPKTVPPDTAAATLAAVYKLPPSQQTCLSRAFAADRAATRPLASNSPARDADLAALGKVAHSCIPASTLATAVVAGAADGTSGLSATQRSCVRDAVVALSPTDQATMLAGLAVPTVLGDIQTALVGRIAEGVLHRCHVTVSGSVPDVSETSTSLP